MIKYPLYVTLDTNIFVSNKFDFGQDSTLGLLAKYVELGKVNVVLSNIVVSEVKKHITDEGDKICGSIRKLRADILKTASEEYIKQIGLDVLLRILDKQEIREKSLVEWERYIKKINPEILDNANINLDMIISDYFNFNPPFENSDKKRKEFPDAFIANQIRERFGNDKVVAIISDDRGLIRACGTAENHLFYGSLGDLYDAMNREETAYQDAVKIVTSFTSRYIREINGSIEDNDCVEVHGMTYDKDGVIDGHDYSETIVSAVRNTEYKIRTIDEITETAVRATLLCSSSIDAECFYEDYDNAVWDSETKSYLYLETKKIFEKHMARFLCRVEVCRDGSNMRIFPFKVILNGDSLIERFEVEKYENDYEQDIIRQDRETLGFWPLDCYDEYLEQNLSESTFKSSIVELFNRINGLYDEYDGIADIYDDLIATMKSQNARKIIKLLSTDISKIVEFPSPADLDKISDKEVSEILIWAEQMYDRLSALSEREKLPDSISYGDVIEVFENDRSYQLVMSELWGNPSAGDEEVIDIRLKDEIGNIIAKGYVKLIVGFINFDDDGGVGDGLEDSIEYLCDDIMEAMKNIIENIESKLEDEKIVAEMVKTSIEIDGIV